MPSLGLCVSDDRSKPLSIILLYLLGEINMNRTKVSTQNVLSILIGVALFSQMSNLDIGYPAKEYLTLIVLKLYFATVYFIFPRFIKRKSSQREQALSSIDQ